MLHTRLVESIKTSWFSSLCPSKVKLRIHQETAHQDKNLSFIHLLSKECQVFPFRESAVPVQAKLSKKTPRIPWASTLTDNPNLLLREANLYPKAEYSEALHWLRYQNRIKNTKSKEWFASQPLNNSCAKIGCKLQSEIMDKGSCWGCNTRTYNSSSVIQRIELIHK